MNRRVGVLGAFNGDPVSFGERRTLAHVPHMLVPMKMKPGRGPSQPSRVQRACRLSPTALLQEGRGAAGRAVDASCLGDREQRTARDRHGGTRSDSPSPSARSWEAAEEDDSMMLAQSARTVMNREVALR